MSLNMFNQQLVVECTLNSSKTLDLITGNSLCHVNLIQLSQLFYDDYGIKKRQKIKNKVASWPPLFDVFENMPGI